MYNWLLVALLGTTPLPPSPFVGPPTFPSWELTQAWMKVKRDFPLEASLVKELGLRYRADYSKSNVAWTCWHTSPWCGTGGASIFFNPDVLHESDVERVLYNYDIESTIAHELWHIHQFHFEPELVGTKSPRIESEAEETAANWSASSKDRHGLRSRHQSY